MNIKASFLSAGLLALGMFASSEAALLLAGVAVIAGRRRKSQ
jgi:hypothetical protein